MAEKRFLDFLDRIDGGGMGQSGDRFEGGGLLSAIANAFGSPYGSEDPERMAARQAFYGAQDIGGPSEMPAPVNDGSFPNYPPPSSIGMPAPVNDGAFPNYPPPSASSMAMPAPVNDGAPSIYTPPSSMAMPAPVNVGAPPSYMQQSSMAMPAPAPVNVGAPPSYMQPSSMAMPASEDPLSFEAFKRNLMENYNQSFVDKMLSSPDHYEPVYDLYVRNGGRL